MFEPGERDVPFRTGATTDKQSVYTKHLSGPEDRQRIGVFKVPAAPKLHATLKALPNSIDTVDNTSPSQKIDKEWGGLQALATRMQGLGAW
jgi:hypothetical protein